MHAVHEAKPLLLEEIAGLVRSEVTVPELAKRLRETRPADTVDSEYAESHQSFSFAVDAVRAAFPDCRFVWVARDGRDVVSSWMRRGGAYCTRGDKTQSPWTETRVRPSWLGEMSTQEWQALPEFEKVCWYWAATNRRIEGSLARVAADRWCLLHIERLHDGVRQLTNRFGLRFPTPPQARNLNQSTNKSEWRWEDWDTKQRCIFSRHCKEMMDRLYAGWRSQDGRWRRIHRYSSRERLLLFVQEQTRRGVMARNPASRLLRSLARRSVILRRAIGW